VWEATIGEVREDFGEVVEKSGIGLTTGPFFTASFSHSREQSGNSKPNSEHLGWRGIKTLFL
jgi:hypothetical protein